MAEVSAGLADRLAVVEVADGVLNLRSLRSWARSPRRAQLGLGHVDEVDPHPRAGTALQGGGHGAVGGDVSGVDDVEVVQPGGHDEHGLVAQSQLAGEASGAALEP